MQFRRAKLNHAIAMQGPDTYNIIALWDREIFAMKILIDTTSVYIYIHTYINGIFAMRGAMAPDCIVDLMDVY